MSDNPTKTQIGYVVSTASDMNVSQLEWDLIWHRNENCTGSRKPQGCLVCDHDYKACEDESCRICAKINGTVAASFSPQE